MNKSLVTTEQKKEIQIFSNTIKDTAEKMSMLKNALITLTPDQLEQLKNSVLLDSLKSEFKNIVNIAQINIENEKQKFLMQFKSERTKIDYSKAIERLELYAKKIDKNLLNLDFSNADDFILDLQMNKNNIYSKQKRSNASIRLDIAGVSSFYTFLERRHENIKNPFRGTKARPAKQTSQKQVEKYTNIIQWKKEIDVILSELPSTLKTAVYIMTFRGLRIGALPNLFINENRFFTETKGKEQRGIFTPDILQVIVESKLDKKRPFDYLNKEYEQRKKENKKTPTTPEQCLKMQINRRIKKLYQQGKINRIFTPHEFRHYYAVMEYLKNKDIHKLSKLLNHSSIQITEIYLKGLNVID